MVIDAIREAVPPFSPEGVTASHAEVCQMYKVREVTGDHYAAQWPVEAWRKAGITQEPFSIIESLSASKPRSVRK